MKEIASAILGMKINVIATLAITAVSSATTLFLAINLGFIVPDNTIQTLSLSEAVTGIKPNITQCETGVYSPVQNRCVSQQIFDAEMQRLLAALGLDGSIYQQQSSTKQ